MRKWIDSFWYVIFLIIFTGCSGCISAVLDPKGANLAEIAKWQAISAAAVAHNSKEAAKLAEINPTTGTITLYNQIQEKPIEVTEAPNAFVEVAKVVAPIAETFIIADKITDVMGSIKGNYVTGDGGTITTTDIRDSGNSVDVATDIATDVGIEQVEDGGTISHETHSGSDFTTADNSSADSSTVDNNSDNSTVDNNSDNRVDSRTNYENTTSIPAE